VNPPFFFAREDAKDAKKEKEKAGFPLSRE